MIWYFFILGIVSINLKNAIPSLLFLGIAFLVKYEAVSFYNTSVKNILSSTVVFVNRIFSQMLIEISVSVKLIQCSSKFSRIAYLCGL